MRFQNLTISLLGLVIISNCGGGGGGSSTQTIPTPPVIDTTPNSISFSDQTDVDLTTSITSNKITISGINSAAIVSIQNGEYSINNGNFTSANGTITNGQKIQVRVPSPQTNATKIDVTLTVGGVSGTFSVTTIALPDASVSINYDVRHIVGGIDTFDRRKFITLHASNTDPAWFGSNGTHSRNAPNASPDLMTDFLEGYDVYLGRDTGPLSYRLGLLDEDSTRPGYADPLDMSAQGTNIKSNYSNATSAQAATIRQHEGRNTDMIMGAQQHPFWPDGTPHPANGWAFSQEDTTTTPLGTATGEYMSRYLVDYFKQSSTDPTGQPKPTFVEVMNEPLYDLVDFATNPTTFEKVFEFHNTIAAEIRKLNPNIKIGGYTAAFPNLEEENFNRWRQRDKAFIDIAGANMDFMAIHLYDFPAKHRSGIVKQEIRSGSNLEATLDMYEQYTTSLFGAPKPFIISEYGAQVHTLKDLPWSPLRDWYKLKSTNAMLMSFLERPNTIEKTIPFIVLKAEWGRISDTVPYQSRLMRQAFEADGSSGEEWVYTELVKFYQLWSEVKGTRVDSISTDPDILIDAYVDGNTSYVILNNLEFEEKSIALNNLGLDIQNIDNIQIQSLYFDGTTPILETTDHSTSLQRISLGAEGTVIVKTEYSNAVSISKTSFETKTYANEMLQPITQDQRIDFSVDNINVGLHGEAVLRVGIGRDHGLSLTPLLSVNGIEVDIPEDFRGYDQNLNGLGRADFFGVIEIPLPYDALLSNNTISLTFPDTGGHVSSLAIQNFEHSEQLTR